MARLWIRFSAYVHAQGWDAEVIVVNDGSRDNTADIVRALAAKDPILRLVENPGNRGKGYSVRNGMLNARGRIVLFSDADLSSPIEEAPKLFQALEEGADIAIGSRWLRAETQTQRQPLHRQLFGRIFNLLLRITLGLQFKDTQCGFKAFKQAAAQTHFPAAENRALGIRSRNPLSRAQVRIQGEGSPRRLGTQRRNPHQSADRWLPHVSWRCCAFAGTT